MHAYILRRLLALLPTVFFASVIVFAIVRMVPGDVIDMMMSQNDIAANSLGRDELIHTLGLDRPMWEQYFRWTGAILLHGDFGNSLWQGTPVLDMIMARVPATFSLGVILALKTIDRT